MTLYAPKSTVQYENKFVSCIVYEWRLLGKPIGAGRDHSNQSSLYFFFFFLNIILFIYLILFLAVLSLHCFVWAFSTCVEWELLSIGVSGLLIVVASHCSAGSRHSGSVVPACTPQSTGSVAVVHGFSCSWHLESSWTCGQTHVPCIGRWFLIRCTTREVPFCTFIM